MELLHYYFFININKKKKKSIVIFLMTEIATKFITSMYDIKDILMHVYCF